MHGTTIKVARKPRCTEVNEEGPALVLPRTHTPVKPSFVSRCSPSPFSLASKAQASHCHRNLAHSRIGASSPGGISFTKASLSFHALCRIVHFFPHHVPLAFVASNPLARMAGETYRADENYRWAPPISASGSSDLRQCHPTNNSNTINEAGGRESHLVPRERGERESFEVYEAKRVRHAGVRLGPVIILYHDALGHDRHACGVLPGVHRTPTASLYGEVGVDPAAQVCAFLQQSSPCFFPSCSVSHAPPLSVSTSLPELKGAKVGADTEGTRTKEEERNAGRVGGTGADAPFPLRGAPPLLPPTSRQSILAEEKWPRSIWSLPHLACKAGLCRYSVVGDDLELPSAAYTTRKHRYAISYRSTDRHYSPCTRISLRGEEEPNDTRYGSFGRASVTASHSPLLPSGGLLLEEQPIEFSRVHFFTLQGEEGMTRKVYYLPGPNRRSLHIWMKESEEEEENVHHEEATAHDSSSSFRCEDTTHAEGQEDAVPYYHSSSIRFFPPLPSMHDEHHTREAKGVQTLLASLPERKSTAGDGAMDVASRPQASRITLAAQLEASRWWLERPMVSTLKYLETPEVSNTGVGGERGGGSIYATQNPLPPPPPPTLHLHVYGNNTQRLHTVLNTLFPPQTNTLVISSDSSPSSRSYSSATVGGLSSSSSSSSFVSCERHASFSGSRSDDLSLPHGSSLPEQENPRGLPSDGTVLSSLPPPSLFSSPERVKNILQKEKKHMIKDAVVETSSLASSSLEGGGLSFCGVSALPSSSPLILEGLFLVGYPQQTWHITEKTAIPLSPTLLSQLKILKIHGVYMTDQGIQRLLYGSRVDFSSTGLGMRKTKEEVQEESETTHLVAETSSAITSSSPPLSVPSATLTSPSEDEDGTTHVCQSFSSLRRPRRDPRGRWIRRRLHHIAGGETRISTEDQEITRCYRICSRKGSSDRDTLTEEAHQSGKANDKKEGKEEKESTENVSADDHVTPHLTTASKTSSSVVGVSHLLPQLEVADISFAIALTHLPVQDHYLSLASSPLCPPLPPSVLTSMGGGAWGTMLPQHQLVAPRLQVLNLSGTNICNDALWALAGRRNSSDDKAPVTFSPSVVAAMRRTCVVPHLHTLRVGCCHRLSDLHPLRYLPQLQHLDAHATGVDNAGIALLTEGDFILLESLSLAECMRLCDVRPLRQLPSLQELDLRHTPVRQGWLALSACSKLRILTIATDFTAEEQLRLQQPELYHSSLSFLHSFHSLTVLQVHNIPTLTCKGLSLLAASRAPLRHLALLNVPRLDSLSPLAAIVTLERLSVEGADALVHRGGEGTRNENPSAPSMGGLNGLAALHSLEQLVLRRCSQLSDFNALHALPALRFLDLRQNDSLHITRDSFQSFFACTDAECSMCVSAVECRTPLPKLQVLLLSECPHLRSLDVFSCLPCLRLLDVRKCGVEKNVHPFCPLLTAPQNRPHIWPTPISRGARVFPVAAVGSSSKSSTGAAPEAETGKDEWEKKKRERGSPLEVLYLSGCTQVTDVRFSRAEALSSLRSTPSSPPLCFPGSSHSTPLPLAVSSLRVLDLSWTGVTDEGIAQLCWLPSLGALWLANCPRLTFLPFPVAFPRLRFLSLADNPILTCVELSRFGHLSTASDTALTFPHLYELDVSRTGVTSTRPLVGLIQLSILRCNGNVLTHKGVMYLSRLPSLETLEVREVTYATHQNTKKEENEEILYFMWWMGKSEPERVERRDASSSSDGGVGVDKRNSTRKAERRDPMSQTAPPSSLPYSAPPPSIPSLLLPPSRSSFLSLLDPLFTLAPRIRRVDLRGTRLQRREERDGNAATGTMPRLPPAQKAKTEAGDTGEHVEWRRHHLTPSSAIAAPLPSRPLPLHFHDTAHCTTFRSLPPPPPASLLQSCPVQELTVDGTEEAIGLLQPILLSDVLLLPHLEVLLIAVKEEDEEGERTDLPKEVRICSKQGGERELRIRGDEAFGRREQKEKLDQFLKLLKKRRPLLSIRFV